MLLLSLLLPDADACESGSGTFSALAWRVVVLMFSTLLYFPKPQLSVSPSVTPGTWGPPALPCPS